jgi:hypothetical protein
MDPKQIASTLRQYALEKSQIENALALRAILQQILASVRLVKINAESIFNGFHQSMAEWEKNDTQSFAQYKEFQSLCTKVLHSVVPPEFRLFPAWMDKKVLQELSELWIGLVPFTAISLHEYKGTEQIESVIISVIKTIDGLFPVV